MKSSPSTAVASSGRKSSSWAIGLSARDTIYLAVMEHHSVSRIMSFDTSFDGFPGIERLS